MNNTTKKIGDMIERQREQRERIADLESQLAARDATIAELTEALEGYREFVVETDSCNRSYRVLADWDHDDIRRHLPASEIAELRRRGVEVGSDNQEDQS